MALYRVYSGLLMYPFARDVGSKSGTCSMLRVDAPREGEGRLLGLLKLGFKV